MEFRVGGVVVSYIQYGGKQVDLYSTALNSLGNFQSRHPCVTDNYGTVD